MQKKAQVTLYFIIGIIILTSIILVLYFKSEALKSLFNKQSENTINIPKELIPVKNYIDTCLEKTSQESIYQIGRSGGYSSPSEDIYIDWFTENVTYYYLDNKSYVPNLEPFQLE